MAVSNEGKNSLKKLSWKHLNTDLAWDRNSLSQADTVINVHHLIEKDMVRESISKMKNGKAAGPLGVVSEMVKVAGEAGAAMITCLVNQILQ